MSLLERRLRLVSGLVVAAFVLLHLVNHIAGLLSLDLLEQTRRVISVLWWNPVGTTVLYAALALHFLLALWALYRRSHLKMPVAEALQYGLGLSVPLLLIGHLVGTRVAAELIGFRPDYPRVLVAVWLGGAWPAFKQTLLVLAVWTHVVVGLHFLFRARRGYRRVFPFLFSLALAFPLLALLGFYRAGLSVEELAVEPGWIEQATAFPEPPSDELRAFVGNLTRYAVNGYWLLLGSVFAARWIRQRYRNAYGSYAVAYPGGTVARGQVGQSILEISRAAGIAHASVCGGRGRCSTCRVRVLSGLEDLPPPNDTERAVLSRIGASDRVRLACQTRPRRDISIAPLVAHDGSLESVRARGGVLGRETRVAILFVDLRNSTRMAESRLPYDVVFLLNRFFAEVTEALASTGGHYAQFNGDGLMAIYGLDSELGPACLAAIEGAIEMQRRIAVLNRELAGELAEGLAIGVGVHCGEAIVGEMGPPDAPQLTAVGDTVNIAARLEQETKTLDCGTVVSADAVGLAGVAIAGFRRASVDLRGRQSRISVYAIDREPAG